MISSNGTQNEKEPSMRQKSHLYLGHYLLDRYMQNTSHSKQRAFLLGCIQPDRNPFTYLKGSIRYQWLRGHNFPNTKSLIRRISRRLEKKNTLTVVDYYTLGKLIHYTADAFTRAHNRGFSTNLAVHRQYEEYLQIRFLQYLREDPHVNIGRYASIMDAIYGHRYLYCRAAADISTDVSFVLAACCCVVSLLPANKT